MKERELNIYLIAQLEKKTFEIVMILIAFLIFASCTILKVYTLERNNAKVVEEKLQLIETLQEDCYYRAG